MEARVCLHLLLCFRFSLDCLQMNCCWTVRCPRQLLLQCVRLSYRNLNRVHASGHLTQICVSVMRLTWDVLSHIFNVHFMQSNFSRSISHCYCAVLVIHNIWSIGFSRGHVYFTYKKPPCELQKEKLPASSLPPTKNGPAFLNKHFKLLNFLPTGTNRRLMGTLNRHAFY